MKGYDFHLDGGSTVTIPVPNALTEGVEDYFHVVAFGAQVAPMGNRSAANAGIRMLAIAISSLYETRRVRGKVTALAS